MHLFPVALSPARRRGNVLLYLPREIRDAIYTLAFTSNDALHSSKVRFQESSNDNTPTMRLDNNTPETFCAYTYVELPGLLLTSKATYHEAYPLFLQTSDFVFKNEESMSLAEAWLNNRLSWKDLHRIVFPDAGLFRIYCFNREEGKVPWNPLSCNPGIQLAVYDDAYSHTSQEYNPMYTVCQALARCTSVRYVEVHIELGYYCEASRLVDPTATKKLNWYYDFACFAEMEGLRMLHLVVNYGDERLLELGYVHHLGPRKDVSAETRKELEDVWGLKSYLEKRFRRSVEVEVEYRIDCRTLGWLRERLEVIEENRKEGYLIFDELERSLDVA
jgi:hypothetical protein